jgi:hypothetical protein
MVRIFPKTILDHDISIIITAQIDRLVIIPACELIFNDIGNTVPKDPEDGPVSLSCVDFCL